MLQQQATFPNGDDSGLVSLAKGGDDAAFEELIRRSYGKCRILANSILHDVAEAEDVTQSGCLKAYRQLHQFKGESTFATWLGRIVVNEARSVRNYRNRHHTVSIDDSIPRREQITWSLRTCQRDPEQQLGTDQVRLLVSREIGCIPTIFRTVLVLRDLREMPVAEIASQLMLPLQTVKTRLFRGRKELRSRMLVHWRAHGQMLFTN